MGEFLTVEELATMVDMHPRTIRRYLRSGQLKASKLGGEWRIRKEDVQAFMGSEVAQTMRTEALDDVTAFLQGTDSEIGGRTQVCVVMDCYLDTPDEALAVSDVFIRHMSREDPDRGQAKYRYLYETDDKRGRYILWGNPSFVGKILSAVGEVTK